MNDSLDDKLKRLGMSFDSGENQFPKTDLHSITDVFNGTERKSEYGTIFEIIERYPFSLTHGSTNLWNGHKLEILNLINLKDQILNIEELIFLDIETTGLSRGSGTFQFLVGLGYFTPTIFKVKQFLLPEPKDEAALLLHVDQLLAPYKGIISFNGNSFDIPFLSSRYNYYHLPNHLNPMNRIDLLSLSRKVWRHALKDRSLANIEREILQFHREGQDVPGWMIPDIYFDFLRSGDARPLRNVVYHNKMDILSMVALFNQINARVINVMNGNHDDINEMISIARMCENAENKDMCFKVYENCLNFDIPTLLKPYTFMRYASLLKRNKMWKKAVELWKEAAKNHDLPAHIELAKYYEHQDTNIEVAIQWTEEALLKLDDPLMSLMYQNRIYKNELLYRLNRLQRKKNQ